MIKITSTASGTPTLMAISVSIDPCGWFGFSVECGKTASEVTGNVDVVIIVVVGLEQVFDGLYAGTLLNDPMLMITES